MDVIVSSPPVTRVLIISCTALSLLTATDTIQPIQLVYDSRAITQRGEIWRAVTPYLYQGPLEINTFWNIYMLWFYSIALESVSYTGKPFTFALMLIWSAVMHALITKKLLHRSITFCPEMLGTLIGYIWGRKNPRSYVHFTVLVQAPASYWAYINLCMSWLTGGPYEELIIAVLLGHFLYYVTVSVNVLLSFTIVESSFSIYRLL